MLYAVLTATVWVLDRWSKILVVDRFPLWHRQPLLGNWLSLTHVRNTGAAFGLLRNQTLLLALVTIGLIGSLFFLRRHIESLSRWGKIGIALVLGGALGNLYDRLFLGYVVDFLELPYWPVFNVADSAVVVGVGLLCIGIWTWEQGVQDGAHSSADSE
jgi:signal peptidase II